VQLILIKSSNKIPEIKKVKKKKKIVATYVIKMDIPLKHVSSISKEKRNKKKKKKKKTKKKKKKKKNSKERYKDNP